MEIELIFCNKCLKNGEYTVPIYKRNEEKNEIEYYCIKDDEIEQKNFIRIKLIDDLKKKLNYCDKHKNNKYCGWCKKCKKNICFLCICQEKHDYIFYCDYYPSIEIYTKFKNLLKEFLLKLIIIIIFMIN